MSHCGSDHRRKSIPIATLSIACVLAVANAGTPMLKQNKESTIPTKPPIAMLEVKVIEGESVPTQVRAECNFPKQLTSAIRRHAPDRHVAIAFARDEDEFAQAPRKLFVSVDRIRPNVMAGGFRPSSDVTLFLSVVVDGALLRSTSKRLVSGVAYDTCGRLEHIAEIGGEFISAWLSRLPY